MMTTSQAMSVAVLVVLAPHIPERSAYIIAAAAVLLHLARLVLI